MLSRKIINLVCLFLSIIPIFTQYLFCGGVTIGTVSPEELNSLLESKSVILLDVRDVEEYIPEHIKDSVLLPLPLLQYGVGDLESILKEHKTKKVVVYCKSGKRSEIAGNIIKGDYNSADVYFLKGGLTSWREAGLTTQTKDFVMPIIRQVHILAGALLVTFTLLGLIVNQWFFAFVLFIGGGLFFSGYTGWCGMAKFLSYFPWNT